MAYEGGLQVPVRIPVIIGHAGRLIKANLSPNEITMKCQELVKELEILQEKYLKHQGNANKGECLNLLSRLWGCIQLHLLTFSIASKRDEIAKKIAVDLQAQALPASMAASRNPTAAGGPRP